MFLLPSPARPPQAGRAGTTGLSSITHLGSITQEGTFLGDRDFVFSRLRDWFGKSGERSGNRISRATRGRSQATGKSS
jgi:hypothetical protein